MPTHDPALNRAQAQSWYDAEYTSDARPIIIGGCGRSGTTLLRVMLDSHPQICCGPESNLFLGPVLPQQSEAVRKLANNFDIAENDVRNMLLSAGSHAEFIDRLFTANARASGKPIWAEKTPRNVRHLDYIFRHFPRARFIHAVRDGRDVVCSLRTHPRHKIVDGRLMETNVRRPLAECVDRWVQDVSAGLVYRADPRYVEVRYEELVRDPRGALTPVLEFLGLRWEEEILRYHQVRGGSRDVTRFPQNPEATEPLSAASIARWRDDLSHEEQEFVNDACGELIQRLGY